MPKINWEKKSVAELKSHLKDVGMSCSGDKGTLIWRIGLNETVESHKLIAMDNKKPTHLKPAELKKCCARAGLSPIGSNDELLSSLVEHLVQNTPSSSSSSSSSSQSSAETEVESVREKPGGVALAKKILLLDENDDFEGILNLLGGEGGTKVTKSSPVAAMRKAYLKLSLQIHPDKISRLFDQATKAFQALVRALERLSQPDLEDDPFMGGAGKSAAKGKDKVATISRSNEGCFRTRVCCPRCRQIWSEGTLDGNPDYFYNFMMTGLKCFSCSTCLCEFGAVTAIHKCPFCFKSFDYSPLDYHRKITCGNAKCTREFGFHLYHISNRVMTEMKKSVKSEQERLAKIQRTKQRRAEGRAAGRGGKLTGAEQEEAFLSGLLDCCPRCGEFFEKYRHEGEAQRLHLLQCGDSRKHAAYQAQQAKEEGRQLAGQKRQAKQLEAQNLAQWEFMGAKSSQLYLLSDSQLRSVAEKEGGESGRDMSKEDLIHSIATTRLQREESAGGSSRKRLKGAESSSSNPNMSLTTTTGSTKTRIDPEDVPGDLHGMSLRELQLFCVSQGLRVHKGATKFDIIEEIENAIE